MPRIVTAGVLGLIAFVISPPCFGQVTPGQSTPGPTSPGPSRDRRLEAAETEISLLKRIVKDQDRRIAELEKTIKAIQAPSSANSEKPTARELAKTIIKPAAQWQNPFAWAQIREGLSRAQVEDLLGKPTSVEAVIDNQTLYYKGEVSGSGLVSGTVKLTDDRVSEINPPAF
jgi:SmpA / OmlA family